MGPFKAEKLDALSRRALLVVSHQKHLATPSRQEALWSVFKVFCLEGDAGIQSHELFALSYLVEVDIQSITKIGSNTNGNVSGNQFVDFFTNVLEHLDDVQFYRITNQFINTAQSVRDAKLERATSTR